MPRFSIRTRNSEFSSRDDGADYDRPEDALAVGVQSATRISADEISSGKPCAAVEVHVDDDRGSPVLCSIVTLSVSPILTDKTTVAPLFE